MIAFIEEEKYLVNVSQTDGYNFTIKISTGEIKFEEIVEWLKNNSSKK